MARIIGSERVSAKLKGLSGEKAINLIGQALFAGGEALRAEASHLITENATSGKNHVPSLPGHPPNEDTGTLRSHIDVVQAGPLKVQVSSNAPYAAALEYGTSKMAPRPYMAPAARSVKKEIVELVRKAVSIATRSA